MGGEHENTIRKSIAVGVVGAILSILPVRYLIGDKIRSKQSKNDSDIQVEGKSIPVDVIEAILTKLPVKSLIRFKLLSKSWKATISDPWFAKMNYNNLSKSHNLFLRRNLENLFGHEMGMEQFSLARLEGASNLQKESQVGDPFGPAVFLCSCNGIVLLLPFNKRCHDFLLWNPSIRRYTMIPFPFPIMGWMNAGLYHDSAMDDYKIVIISRKSNMVFSCKTRSWSEEKLIPCSQSTIFGVHADGCLYWQKKLDHGEILCFNFRDRKTERLKLPGDLEGKTTGQLRLTALWGHLCLHPLDTEHQVWVRENDGWMELTDMLKTGVHFHQTSIHVLLQRHKAVSLSHYSRSVMYNDREKRFEESEIPDTLLLSYSESMFFPF